MGILQIPYNSSCKYVGQNLGCANMIVSQRFWHGDPAVLALAVIAALCKNASEKQSLGCLLLMRQFWRKLP